MKIAVIMGGPSSEHNISLLTGSNVMKALKGKYDVVPIFVTEAGEWLVGKKREWHTPTDSLRDVDLVFNAMHGEYGEDGKVQALLDHIGIPYTGSGTFSSALAMNKEHADNMLKWHCLRIPRKTIIKKGEYNPEGIIKKAIEFSSNPWVIKPVRRGSSVGVSIVRDMRELPEAFENAFKFDDHVMIQEHIKGRELTCGVLENYKGENYYALPPVEIIPPEGKFFDYQVKYDGSTKEICPTDFHEGMLREIKDSAVRAHKALHCSHYSRTDMILKGAKIYILEVNTLPGLTRESLLPKAAKTAGLEFTDFLSHIISLS